jgi:hypothetical protein
MFFSSGLHEGLEELRELDPEYVEENLERVKELEESVAEQEKRYYEKWGEYSEKSDEASEISKPFTHDGFEGQEGLQGELDHIQQVGQEIHEELSAISGEVTDKLFDKDIEEVKEVSPHWAERFVRTKDKIQEDVQVENQKIRESEENDEPYYPPQKSSVLRALNLETQMELAKGGMTPDAIFSVVDDQRGIFQSQHKYFDAKDSFLEKLDKIPYEKAVEILDKQYEEGRVTEANFEALQRTIRLHYGA